jgi:hypothetical protein
MLYFGITKYVIGDKIVLCLIENINGNKLQLDNIKMYGLGSSVGIATSYGLDGPGIEFRWGRGFPHLSRSALRPTQPPVQWIPRLSRGRKGSGREADLSPPSSAEV